MLHVLCRFKSFSFEHLRPWWSGWGWVVVGAELGTAWGPMGGALSCPVRPQTRRSMVFARHLRAVGDEFRSKYLNSTNEADRIPDEEDWTKLKVVSVSL